MFVANVENFTQAIEHDTVKINVILQGTNSVFDLIENEIDCALSLLRSRTKEWILPILQHQALCFNKCNLHTGKRNRNIVYHWNEISLSLFAQKTQQNISILVVLLYSWQISVNTKKFQVLGDVYYGVQIAYYAIIGSQLSILVLSIVLIAGINTVSRYLAFLHFLINSVEVLNEKSRMQLI